MQDQYAAAYGGLNFIEFAGDDQVEVRPLPVAAEVLEALERSLVLAWSGDSRTDDGILRRQVDGVLLGIRAQPGQPRAQGPGRAMRDALLAGDLATFAEGLRQGWSTSASWPPASPPRGWRSCTRSAAAGAAGGRCWAPVGRFMLFAGPPERRPRMVAALEAAGRPAPRSGSTCAAPLPGSSERGARMIDIGGYLASSAVVAAALAERPGRPPWSGPPGWSPAPWPPAARCCSAATAAARPTPSTWPAELMGAPAAGAAGLPGGRPHHRHLGADGRRQRLRLRRRVRPPGRGLGRPGDVLVAISTSGRSENVCGRRPGPGPRVWLVAFLGPAASPRRRRGRPARRRRRRRPRPAGPHHHRPRLVGGWSSGWRRDERGRDDEAAPGGPACRVPRPRRDPGRGGRLPARP